MNPKQIVVGIDASNIKRGGGITHLSNLLNSFRPEKYGIDKIILWGGEPILNKIDNNPWLDKINIPRVDTRFIFRLYWNFFKLKIEAEKYRCNLLFIPGGLFFTNFKPVVTMSRNMLPFEWRELRRFGLSKTTLRYLFLFIFQSLSFKRADGIIFLTNYAKEKILSLIHLKNEQYKVIPHGVNKLLFKSPRSQLPPKLYSDKKPFKFIYISIINKYKHQKNVVCAIEMLRKRGIPITLDLIGPAFKPSLKQLIKKISNIDPNSNYLRYLGEKSYEELIRLYHKADGFIFASSCENMPNILLEAMASGLPIACSNKGPMPEILKEGGLYFNPENIDSITSSIYNLFESEKLRKEKSELAYKYSQEYTWEKCAEATFLYISKNVRIAG